VKTFVISLLEQLVDLLSLYRICRLARRLISLTRSCLLVYILQIYDNAMITAGLNDDPRPMISRLNDLLTKALEKH